ncbi:MAG TPA: class I SAM-dependent methyltransferase [Acidimicrobiales bacterium]|jgi:SAM-dependent methyltransferase|nr:class I SAM-dependent methyltransferase [Acidimicrobiales bacterium]
MLRDAWEANAPDWIAWSRAPGHDSYWRFHRDAFLPLVPPPGRLTLDIGCGEGRVGRDLVRLGHRVIGLDGSPAMATAASSHPEAGGPVVIGDAGHLPLPSGVADCAVAFMCLQDVDEMEAAIVEAARVLAPGSPLVLAITHPLNTAGQFSPGPDEGARAFVIDGSWFERKALADTCERDGFTMTFHTEHRPLQTYTDALADAGFVIERLREVGDPDPAEKWHRIPLFLHLRAIRP